MAIVKCTKGHFYDNNKNKKCPHCESGFGADQTVNRVRDEDLISEKTLCRRFDPVTGWLVCVSGMEMGRDYRIHSGMNDIGRSIDMDIQIVDDERISMLDHCRIVYDPKSNCFYILPLNGNPVYLNEKHISSSERLEENDHIRIGLSDFVFIPYCEGQRKWG